MATRGICDDCPDTKSHAIEAAYRGQDGKLHGLCARHFEAAGLENEHNDNGHDEPVWGCPLCGTWSDQPDLPTLKPTKAPSAKTGRTQVNSSHAGCSHAATKAARAACRRARKAGKAPEIAADESAAPAEGVAPKKARKPRQKRTEAVDPIVARVAQREQELDDAFDDEDEAAIIAEEYPYADDDALLEGLSDADLGC